MKTPLMALPLLAFTAITMVACHSHQTQTQTSRSPVPVYEEPRHHLVFENDIARILDVRVPAGDTTLYHVHASPITGVAIQDVKTWEQIFGAPRDTLEQATPVPYAFDNWDRPLPYTHRVANADTRPFHYVVGEWLGSSGVDCTILPETGSRHLVKDGKVARVYEVRLAPGASTEVHVHVCPGLTVLGTSGTLDDESTAMAAVGGSDAGRWEWRNGGHRHVLRNAGTTPLTVYEIDWR